MISRSLLLSRSMVASLPVNNSVKYFVTKQPGSLKHAFPQYIKQNFDNVKSTNPQLSCPEIMKTLSTDYNKLSLSEKKALAIPFEPTLSEEDSMEKKRQYRKAKLYAYRQGMPKRPSTYAAFVKENYTTVRPLIEGSTSRVAEIAKLWNKKSSAEKAAYSTNYAKDLVKYHENMRTWALKHQLIEDSSPSDKPLAAQRLANRLYAIHVKETMKHKRRAVLAAKQLMKQKQSLRLKAALLKKKEAMKARRKALTLKAKKLAAKAKSVKKEKEKVKELTEKTDSKAEDKPKKK